MTIDIRPARPEEAQELEDFLAFNAGEEHRSIAHEYVGLSFSGGSRRPTFILAIENGRIIGTAAYSRESFTFTTWGISWLNVHPDRRRRGIGRSLLESCLDHIAAQAGERVTVILGTLPGKSKLYDSLGFQKCGLDHQGGWYMTKTVNGARIPARRPATSG